MNSRYFSNPEHPHHLAASNHPSLASNGPVGQANLNPLLKGNQSKLFGQQGPQSGTMRFQSSSSSSPTYGSEINRMPNENVSVPNSSIWGSHLRSPSMSYESKSGSMLPLEPPSAPPSSYGPQRNLSFGPYNSPWQELTSGGSSSSGHLHRTGLLETNEFDDSSRSHFANSATSSSIFRPKTATSFNKQQSKGLQGSRHAPSSAHGASGASINAATSTDKLHDQGSLALHQNTHANLASHDLAVPPGLENVVESEGSSSPASAGAGTTGRSYVHAAFRSSLKNLEEKDKTIADLRLQVEAMATAMAMASPGNADPAVRETVSQMTSDAQGMTHRILTRIRALKEENQRLAGRLSQGKMAQMEMENGILRRENEMLQNRVNGLEDKSH